MTEFLVAIAIVLLLMSGVGLIRLVRGPALSDRIMAVQLFGSCGAAICLVLATVTGSDGVADAALTLALLAAFAATAIGISYATGQGEDREP